MSSSVYIVAVFLGAFAIVGGVLTAIEYYRNSFKRGREMAGAVLLGLAVPVVVQLIYMVIIKLWMLMP